MKMSEQINELAAALSKAQGLTRNAIKDSDNPFFRSKYADLAAIWDACRGPLVANGLAVVQVPEMQEGKVILHTVLMHSSGQWIDGELSMTPVKNDPQSIGSTITYAKRYSLTGFIGVATEDDDGNAASGNTDRQRKASAITEDLDIGYRPALNQKAAKAAVITEAEQQAEAIKKRIDQAIFGDVPDVKDLVKEAKAALSAKPASLPEGVVDQGQAANFERLFKDALKPHLRKQAEDIAHAWLKKQEIVDGDGNGTAKAILKANFYEVRESGVNFAASLEVWP